MISKDKLFEVLKKDNFWVGDVDTGIERPLYLEKLQQFVDRKEVVVLKGIRRCGKSTIMRQFMKRLIKQNVAKEQLLYVNLEAYEFRNSYSLELFERIIEVYKEYVNPNENTYFFIDEIQVIPEWERFIRTVYDRQENIKFFVSGSNASLLSKELSTLLTGRNITLEVKPLSYAEYKTFTIVPRFEEYQLFGGFPEVVLEQDVDLKKTLLAQYFDDIITKDVIQRHKIRNGDNVKNLAKYLVVNSGGRFSYNVLAKALKIDNESVESYINAMKDAYFLIQVNHFSYSFRKRFDKNIQPKYYVSDNGFFQIVDEKRDEGRRFENLVAIYLSYENDEVTYWLEKSEVDFIVNNLSINVTIDFVDIKEREFQGLLDFNKKNKGFEMKLITPKKSYEHHEIIEIVSFEEFFK